MTTGISAHDRAHTVAVAIDPTKDSDDIVSPGHVFPLVAREGGVLVRAGHTEAAVDISRLAGLNPAGVICEIMNDDGTMARMPDLVAFAQLHGLKIGTIADLIAYRRRTERQVERVVDTEFDSVYGGRFRLLIYRNIIDRTEHAVLVKGRIDPDKPTLVRMHRVDMAADMLGHVEQRRDYVPAALRAIAAHDGAGRRRLPARSQPVLALRALRRRPGGGAGAQQRLARLWRRRADPGRPRRARDDPADPHARASCGAGGLWSEDRRHDADPSMEDERCRDEKLRLLVVEARFYDDIADALLARRADRASPRPARSTTWSPCPAPWRSPPPSRWRRRAATARPASATTAMWRWAA